MKHLLFVLSLLPFAALASQNADNISKRNNRINSLCTSLVQAKYDYSHLKGAERDARNRQHAAEIQTCYQAHSSTNMPSPSPGRSTL
jgi:hypothetical protein